MDTPRKPFNSRAFVALMTAFSGLGLPVTGIANHILGFDRLTVARHAWMSAHNILGLIFVVFSVWHVALNFPALRRHLAGASARLAAISREAILAGALVAVVLAVFVGHAFVVG